MTAGLQFPAEYLTQSYRPPRMVDRERAETFCLLLLIGRRENGQGSNRLGKRSVRRYGGRPATVRQEREVWVRAVVDEEPLEEAIRRLGWRVYGTNAAVKRLSLEQAVLAQWDQYIAHSAKPP